MQDLIKAMLHLQHKLNDRTLGPEWPTSSVTDWHLAISQECAEGIDAIGWKWWAKQDTDLEAARIEVIDILHFLLSSELQENIGLHPDTLADRLVHSYDDRHQPLYLDEQRFEAAGGSTIQLFQLVSGLACLGRTNFGLIVLLAEKLGLNMLEVSILYRQKATLNLFRQNHGYKEGAYIKQWGPSLEDNTFLHILSQGINWNLPSAQDLFYGRLNVKYLEVVRSHVKH